MRVFSPQQYWNELTEDWQPEMSFRTSGKDFDSWKREALPKLKELLGTFPQKVPLDAEVEYSVDQGDYIRQRVVMQVDPIMSMPAIVLIPKGAGKGHRCPAIVCSHGHSSLASLGIVGNTHEGSAASEIREGNDDYGLQMVKEGYVTIAPDLRGFGERRDLTTKDGDRDPCNLNYVKGSIFGLYPLTLNISDIMRCIDYLQSMDEVDPDRIGMMGKSLGGTMTTFTTAVEPRIKACDIIAYVNPFKEFAIHEDSTCGSQTVPNLYRYFDTFDISGMIAPRPCLMEMGIYDMCFAFQNLYKGYEETKYIYEAAGAGDKLYADIHPGGHAFSGRKAFDFFRENL